VVLVSHLDTVYPENFGWREEGDRIYGPGVCDIKGGTILLWMILRALRAKWPDLFERIDWRIALNASEEGGCADFPGLLRAEADGAAACLVYEAGFQTPGGGTVVASRKGAARFLLEVEGREAHSGNAHDAGASAIRELCGKVEEIEALTDYQRGVTFNVGCIVGGTMVNCVPGRAQAEIDLRTPTPADYVWGRQALEGLAGEGVVRSADGRYACRVSLSEVAGYPPWAPNEGSDALAQAAVAAGRALGQVVVPTRRKGASDGCHTWDLVPTLDGLGPIGRGTHVTGKESVDRSSFVERALLSMGLIGEVVA